MSSSIEPPRRGSYLAAALTEADAQLEQAKVLVEKHFPGVTASVPELQVAVAQILATNVLVQATKTR